VYMLHVRHRVAYCMWYCEKVVQQYIAPEPRSPPELNQARCRHIHSDTSLWWLNAALHMHLGCCHRSNAVCRLIKWYRTCCFAAGVYTYH
jgi:hypothetical protein